eukprot:2815087-Amphidinium_carterae.1
MSFSECIHSAFFKGAPWSGDPASLACICRGAHGVFPQDFLLRLQQCCQGATMKPKCLTPREF